MTDVQRAYLLNLLRLGRATLYALDRSMRYEKRRWRRDALEAEQAAVQADVDRLALVLGV